MPKLNRIRLANISYDGKHIIDQTFDSYGGENILLNLANGGGKSVLVQMIMQPILPCRRLRERNVDGYLSKTASPSYIMLEWKLDHTVKPLYYLTGIAMCSIAQDDESASRVKYFTFTHKYDAATAYDLAHTPLIELTQSGGYRYMPYNEAFNMLKNVRNEAHPLHCFARDKKEAYQRELEEHGIFPEEWKLLARINDKEGGVDEVFANCKSSDALLDKWILKTISDKTRQEEQNLREMFFLLMAAVLAQEETIQEKELLTGFLLEISQLIEALANLSQQLDSIEQMEKMLSGFYHYLEDRLRVIAEEKDNCNTAIAEQEKAKQQIRYEEISAAWHTANESFLKKNNRLEEQSAITEAQRALFDKAKRDRETMEAAGLREKLRMAQANIAALQEQLHRISTGLSEQDAPDILYSLNMRYTQAIEQYNEALQTLLAELELLEGLYAQYKDDAMLIDKGKQEIAGRLGILEQKIADFALYETQCQKSLGITIHRTLFHELNTLETELAHQQLNGHLDQLKLHADVLESQLKTTAHRRAELAESKIKLTDSLDEIKSQILQQTLELEQYEKHEGTLAKIIERRGLSKHISDIPRSIMTLRESEIQRRTELAKLEAQLVYERDTLARLDANCLHTAAEFGRMLNAQGIVFITGENYLKDMDAEKQKTVLALNPLLPFCFLVGRSDFALATSLYSEGIDRICPVIILEKAEESIKAGEYGVSLTEYAQAMCYYYKDSFAPATKQIFRSNLETALSQSEKSCAEWQKELELLIRDIRFFEDFPYNAQSRQVLTEELETLKAASIQLGESLEKETREVRELEELYITLHKSITENQAATVRIEQDIESFKEYLLRNESYLLDHADQQQLSQKREDLKRQSQRLSSDIDGCNNKITSFYVEKTDTIKQIEALEQKQHMINPPASGEMLQWPLNALERRYEEIKIKQSQDERVVQAEIGYNKEKRQEAEKALRKYRHIQEHELDSVTYNQNQLDHLEKEEKRHNHLLREAEKEQGKANVESVRAQAECASCLKRINEEGWPEALSPSEIMGEYKERNYQIRQKLANLNLKISELDQAKEKCQLDSSRIIRIVDNLSAGDLAPPPDGWQSINIAEQSFTYKDLQSKVIARRNEANKLEHTIKNTYLGQHAGIDHVLGHLSVVDSTHDYEACYFVFERLCEQRKLLQETVRVLESHLEHLDNQKDNVVYHAFAQGKRLYAELKKISESSRVKLVFDKPRQQTLKIGVPDELDPYAYERVKDHVNACITEMRQMKKEVALSEKTIRGIIDTKLSDREILNHTIGQHSINISLLKVDISHANSKLRTWERVLTDNSGGELFVSCFVLLSALMDYSRKSTVPDDAAGSGIKVMLIDNPFGKTSSQHLLDALIQVAEQFKMQMLCLSDLSQSSITAKFALIYQLSLRPSLNRNKSYLKVDSLSNNAQLTVDSRLDHISLRHEQLSVF